MYIVLYYYYNVIMMCDLTGKLQCARREWEYLRPIIIMSIIIMFNSVMGACTYLYCLQCRDNVTLVWYVLQYSYGSRIFTLAPNNGRGFCGRIKRTTENIISSTYIFIIIFLFVPWYNIFLYYFYNIFLRLTIFFSTRYSWPVVSNQSHSPFSERKWTVYSI